MISNSKICITYIFYALIIKEKKIKLFKRCNCKTRTLYYIKLRKNKNGYTIKV